MFNGASNGGILDVAVVNCIFSENTAIDLNSSTGRGGAVMNSSNDNGVYVPSFTNCTFTGNSADFGAAMSNEEVGTAPVLTNCIFWDNTALQGGNPNQLTVFNDLGAVGSIAYSIIEGGVPQGMSDGGANVDEAPLFLNAADPDGADNQWKTSDDGLQLRPCSPAVDAGTATGAPAADILVNARFNGDGGTARSTRGPGRSRSLTAARSEKQKTRLNRICHPITAP